MFEPGKVKKKFKKIVLHLPVWFIYELETFCPTVCVQGTRVRVRVRVLSHEREKWRDLKNKEKKKCVGKMIDLCQLYYVYFAIEKYNLCIRSILYGFPSRLHQWL